jgi:protocatechuate 3,4-dioxygenase beta subunit
MSDLYNLGQSIEKSITRTGEEIRIDLSLDANSYLTTGSVTGQVEDALGEPVAGALIKILNTSHDPLYHTLTDSAGTYVITGIKPSSVLQLQAIKEGYLLSAETPFSISSGQSLVFDVTLQTDPNAAYSTIAGHVTDDQGDPVGNLTATLIKIEGESETVISMASTNEYGQYVFVDVQLGVYIIRLSGEDYDTQETELSVTQQSSISNLNTIVIPAQGENLGTINGIITDDEGDPIVGATVVLYEVETVSGVKHYRAFRYTKTSVYGIYLFGSVPQGDYIIKSNKEG